MHSAKELMRAVDVRFGEQSAARTAKVLGTNSTSVDDWRRGTNIPSDRFASAIAEVIGIDRQYVRACLALAKVIESEREHALSTMDTGQYASAIRAVNTLLERAAGAGGDAMHD